MKVKFYGNGSVFGIGRIISVFTNGEFITENEDIINILIDRGYKHDILDGDPVKVHPPEEEETKAEIIIENPKPKKRGRKKAK